MKKTSSLTLIVVLSVVSGTANADFAYGEPTNLGPTINTSAHDLCPRISTDGLSLFFPSERSGGVGGRDIYVTTRATKDDPWGAPVNLGPTVNSSSDDYSLSISADGLSLYFVSKRAGGFGAYDLWVTTRPTTSDSWGAPVNLGPEVNGPSDTYSVAISADSLTLHFTSNRPGGSGGYDVWVTTRPTTSDPWNVPVNLGPNVNGSSNEYTLGVSTDDRSLYVVSDRSGGHGSLDIWVTRRTTANDDWGALVNLGPEVNSSGIDGFPGPSADGRTLFFSSDRPGGSGNVDLWQVPITPIVDFNGDGAADGRDVLIMTTHWGQDYPLCDIGPTPFGDGVVDVQDLIVLAEHIGREVDDPTLLAHWAFDETEGPVAYDSAGFNDGAVIGAPTWQPSGGQADGALELNGATLVAADHVLNPSDGPFSVFAWVRGGAPGQVILSGEMGVNWLMADTEQAALRTDISDPVKQTRQGTEGGLPLISRTVITDAGWHRIGLVWDGSDRILYVDDVEVARDTVDSLEDVNNDGLNIGVGADLQPDTFFSGLIDDVRIYNRPVRP